MSYQPPPGSQEPAAPESDQSCQSPDGSRQTRLANLRWTTGGLVVFALILTVVSLFLSALAAGFPELNPVVIAILLVLALFVRWDDLLDTVAGTTRNADSNLRLTSLRNQANVADNWLSARLPNRRSARIVISELGPWVTLTAITATGYIMFLYGTIRVIGIRQFSYLVQSIYLTVALILLLTASIPAIILVRKAFYLVFGRAGTDLAIEVKHSTKRHMVYDQNRLLLGLILFLLLFYALDRTYSGELVVDLVPAKITHNYYAQIDVTGINYNPVSLSASISLKNVSADDQETLLNAGSLTFANQNMALRFDQMATSSLPVAITIPIRSDDSYRFPFSNYFAFIDNHWLSSVLFQNMSMRLKDESETVDLYRGAAESDLSGFQVRYAPYYKIVTVVIAGALLMFLWAIYKARRREELFELSIGVFAALIAIRSYLLPNQLQEPSMIDRYILFYIATLMIVFIVASLRISSSEAKNS